MKDSDRKRLLRAYAAGYVVVWVVALAVAELAGKAYGQWLVLIVYPVYSMLYIVAYRNHSRQYKDETRKMLAFGLVARGTFTGAVYYASMAITLLMCLVWALVLIDFVGGS